MIFKKLIFVTISGLILIKFNLPLIYAKNSKHINSQTHKINDTETINNRALFQKISQISELLDLIRLAMGKIPFKQYRPVVSGATINGLYNISLLLLEKSGRLAYDVGKPINKTLEVGNTEPTLSSVQNILDKSFEKLLEVGKVLNIQDEIPSPEINDQEVSMNDLVDGIVRINNKLNQLFYNQYAPGEVYQQITLALFYSSLILDKFEGVVPVPQEIPFIKNKTPVEVFRQLLLCLELINRIQVSLGLKSVVLKFDTVTTQNTQPSDVYDLSRIIVNQIKYLYRYVYKSDHGDDQRSYYSGYKKPSDVYQRANMLKNQLKNIEKQIKLQPNVLKKHQR